MSDSIQARCLSVIGKFVSEADELKRIEQGESIIGTGSLDSLSMVNLVVELEAEFGISVDTDDIEHLFESISSLTSYISSRLDTR